MSTTDFDPSHRVCHMRWQKPRCSSLHYRALAVSAAAHCLAQGRRDQGGRAPGPGRRPREARGRAAAPNREVAGARNEGVGAGGASYRIAQSRPDDDRGRRTEPRPASIAATRRRAAARGGPAAYRGPARHRLPAPAGRPVTLGQPLGMGRPLRRNHARRPAPRPGGRTTSTLLSARIARRLPRRIRAESLCRALRISSVRLSGRLELQPVFRPPLRMPVYGDTGYGYYAIDAGFAYGSLRIVDAPAHAQVFVDGYYAGEVDEVRRRLPAVEPHAGSASRRDRRRRERPAIEFEVASRPGETITYRVKVLITAGRVV